MRADQTGRRARWLALIAPGWEPAAAAQQPSPEMIIGGWWIDNDAIRDVIATLRHSVVDIGYEADGRPVSGAAEDVPCVLIITAAVHRRGIEVDTWLPLTGEQLADVVPAGVDILINPVSHASCRLTVAALRGTTPREQR